MNPAPIIETALVVALILGAAYLVIHYHVTVAMVKGKLESLAIQLGLVHTAALSVLAVPPVSTTSAAAAPAAAAPAAAPAPAPAPAAAAPAPALKPTDFLGGDAVAAARAAAIAREAPQAPDKPFDPIQWGANAEQFNHTFNDAQPVSFQTVIKGGVPKAMACGAGYVGDVTPVITDLSGRVLAGGYGVKFSVDADTPATVTVTPNKVPAGCSIELMLAGKA